MINILLPFTGGDGKRCGLMASRKHSCRWASQGSFYRPHIQRAANRYLNDAPGWEVLAGLRLNSWTCCANAAAAGRRQFLDVEGGCSSRSSLRWIQVCRFTGSAQRWPTVGGNHNRLPIFHRDVLHLCLPAESISEKNKAQTAVS